MPNEVYAVTHEALSALVSHRAATRVLDAALEATGTDPDRVTVRAMRRLLAGRVRRELSATLPSPGLTLSLKRIADDLYHLQPSHDTIIESVEQPSTRGTFEPAHGEPVLVEAGSEPVLVEAGSAASANRNPAPPPAPPEAAPAPAAPPVLAPDAAPAPTPVRGHRLELDERVIARAVTRFGELETVDQVVIVEDGQVLLERGAGVATDSLPNLVKSTQHLLARAGRLKLFALQRAEGMLFVFPVGTGAVVVLTQPNVNIGAVLAARAALEEAA